MTGLRPPAAEGLVKPGLAEPRAEPIGPVESREMARGPPAAVLGTPLTYPVPRGC